MGFLSKEMSRAHYWRGQSAMLAMDGHSDKKKMRQNEYDTFLNLQEIL